MNVSNYGTEDKKTQLLMSHSLTLSLSKTGGSLGPITLTVTHGIRPYVTFNVMLSSPYISQANARQ